jgi:hypothetical protein
MATDEKRRILEMVATKEITPAEGVELLGALGDEKPDKPPSTVTEESEGIMRIKVIGTFKSLQIEGDPSITGAIAEGPHKARVEGGTMIIEDEATEGDEDPGFVLFGPSRWRGLRIDARGKGKSYRFDSGAPPIKVRMNPGLPLDIELTAGSAKVTGVTGPIDASLTAGSARFEGIRSPFRASVEAGALRVSGRLDSDKSKIQCTAGKVDVRLDKASSVRINAQATLGAISLPDSDLDTKTAWAGIGGGSKSVVVGNGDGELDVEATTGTIKVSVE